MLVYSRKFSENMRNFEAKYLGKYAEFCEICGSYVLHMPHVFDVFFPIFLAYATSSDGELIIIIPILHSFDIFDFTIFNV